ncbi:hypothetical protein BLOT_009332 [Blomia tropicalis]|nr:hypothetical protein BLOT_009332 [Blomia tropicalis]
MEQQNEMIKFCQLYEFEEFIDYFKANVYDSVNDFLKNGLQKFLFDSTHQVNTNEFICAMKKYQKQVIENSGSSKVCSNIMTSLKEVIYMLESDETQLKKFDAIIISPELGWVIKRKDLVDCAGSVSKKDLDILLSKVCGKSFFKQNESFEKLSDSTKEALEKIANKYTKIVMLDFVKMIKLDDLIEYFTVNVYVDVNDFDKNGLKMFQLLNDIELVKQFMESYNLWAPKQRKQISDDVSMSSQISMSTHPSTSPLQIESFKTITLNAEETDTIDLANRVLRIEENMNNYSYFCNNRVAKIEKCLNLNSDDDKSKITAIEDSLVDIKTFVDKLKNLLIHGESFTMNNGTVVIDADLGWVATKEDLIRCGTSTPKTDLSDFLDKIVGRELFENYNSFDQLSKPYQDALYKLAAVFIKAKSDVNNVSGDISTVTKSRIRKRFQNIKKKQKTTHSSTATNEDDTPPNNS